MHVPTSTTMLLSTLITVLMIGLVTTAADDEACSMPKAIDCYNCDSRKDSFCFDPFNLTDSISLQSTRKCDSECIKWNRQIEPGDPDSEWYIMRLCKSDVSIGMYLSPNMCIGESRPGSGKMCTCNHDRCNKAGSIAPSQAFLIFTTIILTVITV